MASPWKKQFLVGILIFLSCSWAWGMKMPAEIYRQVSPSVVLLISNHENSTTHAKGTGSIIGNGLVLTNAHVVLDQDGARYSEITVFLRPENVNDNAVRLLKDGYRAKVLHLHQPLDLALLSIEGLPPIDPVVLGNAEQMGIGDPVLAIGHPENGGLWSLTSGRIGSIIKNFREIEGKHVLQTEASLNRGNSGGPLLNYYGQMVGVNTSAARQADDGLTITGINFAVNSNVVQRWLDGVGISLSLHSLPTPVNVAVAEQGAAPQPAPVAIEKQAPSQAPDLPTEESPSVAAAEVNPPDPSGSSPATPDFHESTSSNIPSSPTTGENQLLTPKRTFKDEDLFEAVVQQFEKKFEKEMEKEYDDIDTTMERVFNSF